MRLDGKVALITGGGTGIGAAIAKRFIDDGAKICITGRRQAKLDQVAELFPEESVATCTGDISKIEDVQKMVDATLAFGSRIDVLVNNAAIDPGGTITDIDLETWKMIFDINLMGSFFAMRLTIPHMIEAGGGSVINISSLGGLVCLPGMPAYCTSKAALNMLTKQAALDYGVHKIRCNAVCPGATRTEMLEEALTPLTEVLSTDMDGVFDVISSNVPLHRVATPDEVGGICSFLASDDSSFMTGSVIMVDGGASVVDVSGAALSSAGVNWGV